ncbi:MAG: hypothetical protein RLY78_3707 [Pseudomonadota bacterium]
MVLPLAPEAAHVAAPSPWLLRWAHLLPAGSAVLDLACGSGRHVRWLAARGHRVTGVDRDAAALAPLADVAHVRCVDLEHGPWPLHGERFDAVLVTNYLWRPRWDALTDCVAPGGWLIYETFGQGQAAIGRPSRPEFLLQPGELLQRCAGWQIIAYEDGLETAPERCVQRIIARRPPSATGNAATAPQGATTARAAAPGPDTPPPPAPPPAWPLNAPAGAPRPTVG